MTTAAMIAPLTISDGIVSLFHLVSTDDGRCIHPWYKHDVNIGATISQTNSASEIRSPNGSHFASARLVNPSITSCAGNLSGVFSAYCGSNRNFVLHSSQRPRNNRVSTQNKCYWERKLTSILPSPLVTSNQDTRQSW